MRVIPQSAARPALSHRLGVLVTAALGGAALLATQSGGGFGVADGDGHSVSWGVGVGELCAQVGDEGVLGGQFGAQCGQFSVTVLGVPGIDGQVLAQTLHLTHPALVVWSGSSARA